MVETQYNMEQISGTPGPHTPVNTQGTVPRSSLFLQMDKHRRLCKERHDLYLCEVAILGGLKKTQSVKLRELNEIKTKVTLSKQSHRGPRTSKKAIKEMGAEDDHKRL